MRAEVSVEQALATARSYYVVDGNGMAWSVFSDPFTAVYRLGTAVRSFPHAGFHLEMDVQEVGE